MHRYIDRNQATILDRSSYLKSKELDGNKELPSI